MDTQVSYREINIENPQTGKKIASTTLPAGMWLHSSGFLLRPLAPAETVYGLNLTPVPATDATNNEITFDGINSTEDRFVMPVANTMIYSGLTGTFAVGELVFEGATLLTATAVGRVIFDNGSTTMSIVGQFGTFGAGTITGNTSGATATFVSITSVPTIGGPQRADIAADSISLDMNTLGFSADLQFQITRVISAFQVEVAVRRLAL